MAATKTKTATPLEAAAAALTEAQEAHRSAGEAVAQAAADWQAQQEVVARGDLPEAQAWNEARARVEVTETAAAGAAQRLEQAQDAYRSALIAHTVETITTEAQGEPSASAVVEQIVAEGKNPSETRRALMAAIVQRDARADELAAALFAAGVQEDAELSGGLWYMRSLRRGQKEDYRTGLTTPATYWDGCFLLDLNGERLGRLGSGIAGKPGERYVPNGIGAPTPRGDQRKEADEAYSRYRNRHEQLTEWRDLQDELLGHEVSDSEPKPEKSPRQIAAEDRRQRQRATDEQERVQLDAYMAERHPRLTPGTRDYAARRETARRGGHHKVSA